ncbi:MAG: hypothetical protein QXT20_00100 [Candidatus Woesearchaeota archaeon]
MVKGEVFGSRKSKIKEILKTISKIDVINNLWFCTCLSKYNRDPNNRYVIFYECFNHIEFNEKRISFLRKFFKTNVPIIKVLIQSGKINFFNVDSEEFKIFEYNSKSNNDEAAKYILSTVNCLCGKIEKAKTYLKSSNEISELSKFLRRDLFGRLGATDIDFIISTKKGLIFLEEKLYLDSRGGSLGLGEYLSFIELLKDVVNEQELLDWSILFFDNSLMKWYRYNFKIEPVHHERFYDYQRKEKRVLFPKEELEEIDIKRFIEKMVEENE